MKPFIFCTIIFAACYGQILKAQIPTNVFEITSILVDGCDGNNEGQNEMVMFQIGPNPINASDLRVDGALNTGGIQTGKWPNTSNLWLGVASSPAKPAEIAQINATITACGKLIEPVGGILPAGKKVLLITSTAFNPAAHSFATLNDTLYVIFQNAGNTAGHFVNFGTSSNRTLRLFHVPTSAYDQVTYDRSLLVDQSGASVAADGASVSYTWTGAATYYNNGCQAPYIPLDASWTPPTSICNYASPINLNTLITGTSGGTWSGNGVTGNTFDPSGLSGSVTVTYTVGSAACHVSEPHSINIIPASDPTWDAPASLCQSSTPLNLNTLISGTTGGTWTGTGVSGNTFNPSGLNGGISITYTVGTSPCVSAESHTIQVITSANASWASPGSICESASPVDLSGLVSGTPGGTWTGNGVTGGTFDPAGLSGNINIIYTVGTGSCSDAQSHTITVIASPDASWDSPGTVCQNSSSINLNNLISGTPGGTWSGNGVNGNMFNPTGLNGNISITYTAGTAPCQSSESNIIVVVAQADASWTAPAALCENAGPINLTTFITGTPGGTWSGNGVSGTTFNPAGQSGSVTVTYTAGASGCEASETHTIQIDQLGNPQWTTPPALCQSQLPLDLNTLVTGDPGGVWSGNGVNGNMLQYSGTSSVAVTYTVVNGTCAQPMTGNINIQPVEALFFANPSSGTAPLPVDFINNSTGLGSSDWNLGNEVLSTNENPSTTYESAGTYTVTLIVTTPAGCKDTAKAVIKVFDEISIFIPNVITPNGDLNNEIFKPVINNPVDQFKGIIFNRWGGKVSEFDLNGWDGKNDKDIPVASGVYAYVISFNYDGKFFSYHGSVTVLY